MSVSTLQEEGTRRLLVRSSYLVSAVALERVPVLIDDEKVFEEGSGRVEYRRGQHGSLRTIQEGVLYSPYLVSAVALERVLVLLDDEKVLVEVVRCVLKLRIEGQQRVVGQLGTKQQFKKWLHLRATLSPHWK